MDALPYYFFHINNKKDSKEELQELRMVLQSEPYSKAISGVDSRMLTQQARLFLLAFRTGSPYAVKYLYKLKVGTKKIKSLLD